MTTGDFDLYYSSEPWSNIATNQRQWYDPFLREYYYKNAVYSRFVTSQFNLANVNAKTMSVTSLIPPHSNSNSIGLRQLWLPSSYVDSYQRDITFSRYGQKLALHKYDPLITYWQTNPSGGLQRIINIALGRMLVETLDKLARNAFLSNSFKMIGDGTFTGFDQVGTSHYLTSSLIEDIHLGMKERGVPYAQLAMEQGTLTNLFAITTPGEVRKIRESSAGGDWIDVMKYANPQAIVRGEVGAWKGLRLIESNDACLYNCGTISKQTTVIASIEAGDGASAPGTPVDGTYKVGQASGVVNYIQCSAFAPGEYNVNDIVTVHVARTSANGVTNGVDYTDGKLMNRRVVAVDAATDRLTFDRPIMEDFKTDLGGGVYGYVTKGRHIHTSTFIGGTDGVVLGVGQQPMIHTPKPVDDFDSVYRVSWDGYLGYQVFEPMVFENWFGAGPNRIKGPTVN